MDLNLILQKWQHRLGLTDWDITVKFRDCVDMDNYPARTKIKPNIQHATIRVMALEDRQKNDACDADPELDLVHELIHVRLWAIDPTDAEGALYTCREQAIEWIAKALVASDRGVL